MNVTKSQGKSGLLGLIVGIIALILSGISIYYSQKSSELVIIFM